jgi:ABC-type dipeptide/oligopeptide/nickel transport system permease subunit
LIAGYWGGSTDNLLMRITDIVYAFPDLLFFIIVMTALRARPSANSERLVPALRGAGAW